MDKHLLVTFSEQQSALNGVRFVGRFFSNKKPVKLTLFYTAPKPPAVWAGDRDHESVSQAEQLARQYEAKGRTGLEAAKKELIKSGFKQEQIATKLQVRQKSKVMDIIQEGEKGLYDAVVLGRRGLSWLEEAFDESVSRQLLQTKCNFPIWVCRRPEMAYKNVLVCVDGSDGSYRMADHVGFILAQDEEHEVTLLVVKKNGKTARENAEHILSKSKEQVSKNGFPAELIRTKAVESGNVGRAVLREAEQGRFAAVAAGRTGRGQGLLKRVFMGSVSTTLFRELEHAALWTCH